MPAATPRRARSLTSTKRLREFTMAKKRVPISLRKPPSPEAAAASETGEGVTGEGAIGVVAPEVETRGLPDLGSAARVVEIAASVAAPEPEIVASVAAPAMAASIVEPEPMAPVA